MRIVVCVKQIPDPATPGKLDSETNRLIRPAEQILDDTDRYGIEVGLNLAEQTDGTVCLLSMGPSGTMQGIRQALAMGADQAVMVDDPSLEDSDALTTARVLAAAARRQGFDLVVTGVESTDGYSGVVPQMIAEFLEVPALTFARRVEMDGADLRIERQTASGFDNVRSGTPAVLSVTAGAVEPRYPTFRGIMAAKNKPIETMTAADLGVAQTSGQRVVSVEPAPERQGGEVVEDDGTGHLRIVEFLESAKVI
ncbi:MAG: electron transfer flavoprotein subunit beta/FixA family protein [Acidimicrobiia bacterium]|nr:electron transfer flavoprotein subunit beta/FixA family protein [bacterium]MCY3653060.1 electron transfer flavoprotein subunit beta/FixA family protein [bacterium]MXX65360.1 electron transfer flavoprotein subunit beta/FixA family protein [Acidimicrobiia bacterium]MXZ07175.1 electron transfer flavoprotein subunit beta/FixA family protein [Acidimicrobiia bacterium]MYF26032.1 electron transfer flavoprotein subunit beta/FixA family protein [Acidimicrobiia bacterium]